MSNVKYRADIDGLRALAVIAVIGFHAFPDLVPSGFIGVDIFFVISGFLISTIIFDGLEKKTFSFLEFYSRRIKRIFPALILVLVSCSIFGWFYLLADEYQQLGKHIAGGAGFISNYIFWDEAGYFDNVAETKPLLHLWSLGIEEQFYILMPFVLWLVSKLKFKLKLNFNFICIVLCLAAFSFYLNVENIVFYTVSTFYSPQTRFWELLCGSALAWVALYKNNLLFKRPLYLNLLSIIGFLIVGYGLYNITKFTDFPGVWALSPVFGAVFIILAGPQAWLNRLLLSQPLLVGIGLISYPLYLWHWPLLSFARIIEGEVPSLYVRCLIVIISVVLSLLTYFFVEKKIRYRNATIFLIVLMSLVGGIGYITYVENGLGFRFPKIVQDLTAYKYDVTDWGGPACYLAPEDDYTRFGDCGVTRDKTKKTILIWGDSHAGHLYLGYKKNYLNYNIIPRAASACPPILDWDARGRIHCKLINEKTFELIEKEKPDRVVLSMLWTDYAYWENISVTIQKLKAVGIVNIDIIGPDPYWNDGLPKQLFKYLKKDLFREVPFRMSFGLNDNFLKIDPLVRALADREKVNYISPIGILCNDQGCLTRTGENGESLIAFDYGHFTNEGSIYLVSKFPKYD